MNVANTDLLSGTGSSVELIPKMSASGVYKQKSDNCTSIDLYFFTYFFSRDKQCWCVISLHVDIYCFINFTWKV